MKKSAKNKNKLSTAPIVVPMILLIMQAIFPWDVVNHNAVVHILLRVILCAPSIVLTWLDKDKKSVLIGRIITTASLLLISFAPVFLPDRAVVATYMVMPIILAGLLLVFIHKRTGSTSGAIWLLEIIYFVMVLMLRITDYEFVNGIFAPYWYIGVIGGVTVSAIITFISYKKKGKDHGLIMGFLVYSLLLAFFFMSIICNLNYVLDTSEPQEYTLPINEVEYKFGSGKSPGYYKLAFAIDGEEYWIRITKIDQYVNQYRTGDIYTFYRYEGALGEPFFLSGKYKN